MNKVIYASRVDKGNLELVIITLNQSLSFCVKRIKIQNKKYEFYRAYDADDRLVAIEYHGDVKNLIGCEVGEICE